MSKQVGLWLVGARGGVALNVALGLSALRQARTSATGLVSELEIFQPLDLLPWDQIVVGGHDIRECSLVAEAQQFQRSSRAFEESLVAGCAADLEDFDGRIRLGVLANSGEAIQRLASPQVVDRSQRSGREKVEEIKEHLAGFSAENGLVRTVVINVASTEPPVDPTKLPSSWDEAERLLDSPENPFPSSCLYAIAAMELGHAFVNFTPSMGSNTASLCELAERRGTLHAGQDGKTGETLIKSALAPVFALRNLQVMSWVGHNIFGNMDGRVLEAPENKRSKVASKDRLLSEILGYHPQTHISIEYIKSMGDWKTAWDHIHFQGFLGTPMTMQFTWQGCDSLLAAPLVIDLFRFTERAERAGQIGLMKQLSCFFKSPMGVDENNFTKQFEMLQRWNSQMQDCTA